MRAPRDTKNKDEISEPAADAPKAKPRRPKEIGGPKGPEPTRYGDWERDGRCVDFRAAVTGDNLGLLKRA